MATAQRYQRLFLFFSYAFELTKGALVLIAISIILHTFVATIFIIEGASMEPNLHSGEVIVVSKFGYLFGAPKRGDVVVLRYPGDPYGKKYIKRIVAVPGERLALQGGSVVINDYLLEESYLPAEFATYSLKHQGFALGENEYVALGDNRPISNDSRIWGVLPKEFIIGRATMVLWPLGKAGFVGRPAYAH